MEKSKLTSNEEAFGTFLARHFSPSREIDTPERLLGRERSLTEIRRAFASPGRQVFVYGERGVGKTSLATTAAHLNSSSDARPIFISCDSENAFSRAISSIYTQAVSQRFDVKTHVKSDNHELNFGARVFETKSQNSQVTTYQEPLVETADDAKAIINFISQQNGERVIVIDEMDRITCDQDKRLFAEFSKAISSLENPAKIIFVGIGETIEDLIGQHASYGRYIEPIKLETLPLNTLWTIVSQAAQEIEYEIENNFLQRIALISDGFPHYVHLLGQCIFWDLFDQKRNKLSPEIFSAAVRAAIEKSEVSIKSDYQRATEKTRNTVQFELSLWALADTSETRRQVSSIYSDSLLPIVKKKPEIEMNRDLLNRRLLDLRGDRHGNVVTGHGAGWFSFTQNVFRGFVRMKAFESGVDLRRQD